MHHTFRLKTFTRFVALLETVAANQNANEDAIRISLSVIVITMLIICSESSATIGSH
jgi:hypothetical protein